MFDKSVLSWLEDDGGIGILALGSDVHAQNFSTIVLAFESDPQMFDLPTGFRKEKSISDVEGHPVSANQECLVVLP